MSDDHDLLEQALAIVRAYRDGLDARPPAARAGVAELRSELAGPLADAGVDGADVLAQLARAVEPGLVATSGPRWFGFVDGGTLPIAVAADILTAGWDQNAGLAVVSPAAAAVEDVVAGWTLDLLGLPGEASVGFVTGGQMANFTCLAAARGALLRHAGWDVHERGLWEAPALRVLLGEQAHGTIVAALRMLGIGSAVAERVEADGQGRMRPQALARALERSQAPTLVCVSAGNVNTGAFDPIADVLDAVADHGGPCWVHVDGAFGLWAAASARLRGLVAGVERADSWTVDAHKWLNVPYDSGMAIVRDADAHRAAMAIAGPYLVHAGEGRGDGTSYVPEASRRARGFVLYATLRALGRSGVAAIVEGCCAHAHAIAERLRAADGVEVLNDVVLNQVLVRFPAATPQDGDDRTRAVIAAVQRDATCWVGGTLWQGRAAMRISVCSAATTARDADRGAAAVLAAAAAVRR